VLGLLVLGQNPETELLWLVSGHTIQNDGGDGAGGCWGEVGEVQLQLFVWLHACGSQFWAKIPKPSVRCSVSGVPCETAM
jgi:hypothetical protein